MKIRAGRLSEESSRRHLSRPSDQANITPCLHLSLNEVRPGLCRDPQNTRIRQGAAFKLRGGIITCEPENNSIIEKRKKENFLT